MIRRCYKTNVKAFVYYGKRDIAVCDEWRLDFIAFREWSMANGYQDDLTIDRIDNDGNYEPSNCRWVNYTTQANNKSDSRFIEVFGERKTLADWARDPRCKVDEKTLFKRILRGWNLVDSITFPLGSRTQGLKPTDIPEIRRRLASGETHAKIAASYGVCRSLISCIKSGRLHADAP